MQEVTDHIHRFWAALEVLKVPRKDAYAKMGAMREKIHRWERGAHKPSHEHWRAYQRIANRYITKAEKVMGAPLGAPIEETIKKSNPRTYRRQSLSTTSKDCAN